MALPASPEPVGFTDDSCHHAVLGTLLLERAPDADPAGVLGNTTATRAGPDPGPVGFGDTFPALGRALAARGLGWERHPVHRPGAWTEALRRMAAGERLITVVDPFHLSYHRQDYGLAHGLHAVLLSLPRGPGGPVLLDDPMTATRYTGPVDPDELERALFADDFGQTWTLLGPGLPEPVPGGSPLADELRGHAAALADTPVPDAEGGLTAGQLLDLLDRSLPETMTAVARLGRPEARAGADQARRHATNITRGLWNTAQTMRWFARYLHHVREQHPGSVPEAALTAAGTLPGQWSALRTLLLRAGLSSGDRAELLAQRLRGQLRSTGAATEALATALARTRP
ncbi:hypothetical protein [Streptacidiphilus cavernicola]|uniref:Butirosin biosynthesis protein H N-terminal domain-containing protein n=1 Tax=Streptacidiphilus cavernicola TaxID=3342716 RepID=A0ABV6VSH2_9ACTN